jgi:hypothetical protein
MSGVRRRQALTENTFGQASLTLGASIAARGSASAKTAKHTSAYCGKSYINEAKPAVKPCNAMDAA